jgi:hypothetical protein
MQDLFYIFVTVAFFAIAAWYVVGLKKLQGEAGDE